MAKLIKSKSGKLGLLGDDNMVTPIDLNSMNIIRNKSGKYGLLENNQVTPIDSFDIDAKELDSLVSNPFKKKEDTELSSQTDSTAGKSDNSFLEDYVFSPIVTGTENVVSSMINFLSGNLDVAYREVVGAAKSFMSKGDIDYLIEKQKKEANPISNALYEVSGVLSDAAQYGRIDALRSRGVTNPEGSFIDDFTDGNISDGISKISYDVVATIPQVVSAVAAGGTSAQLGTRFAFPAVSATGSAIGEEVQKDNNLSDVDFIQSALKGTIEGIVEAVAIRDLKAVETIGGKIANVLESDALAGIKKSITNIGKKETKDEIVRGVGGILKNAFKGGGEEGLEEVASGIGSFIVDRIDANEPITQQSITDLSKSLLENFTIGFVSGGALSGVAATASRVPLTQEQQKKIDKFNEIVNDENQAKEIRDIAKQKADEILKFNADQSSEIYDKIVSLPKETRGEAISYLQQAKKLEEQKSSVKDIDLLNSIEEKIQSYNDNFNKLVEENIKAQEQVKAEEQKAQEQMPIVADVRTGQIEIPFKFEETMIKPSIKLNVGTLVSPQTLKNKEGIIPTLTPVIQDRLMAYNEALKSVAPETNIVLYNNDKDLAKGIEESGYSVDVAQSTAKESKGLYDPKGNIIHINIAKADPTTLPHEIFHPVVAKIANENPQEFTRMKDTISKRLSESTVSELKQFASQYEGKDVQAEEFLAQLSGLITANKAKFDKPFLYKLALDFKEFIRNIGNKINSKALVKFADSIFTEQTNQEELINFFEGYAKSLQMGKPIDTRVLEGKAVTKDEVDNILSNPKTVRTAEEVTPNVILKAQRADVTKTPVAGNRLFSDTPLVEAKTIAQEYMDSKGMKYEEGKRIQSVNVERAKRIADAYIAMEDNYSDPQVKEAYNAMISETIDQYKAIIDKGYVVEINNTEPYKNSQEFIDDLRGNKRFKLLSTRASFGDTPITAEDLASNPLLQETEYRATNGETLLVNDLFRFVHDFFGHSIRGNSLGAIGEENAWDEHSRMYSPLARRAMTSETRGQNSYVNFSGVNDDAFKLRSYARQLRSEGRIEEANKIVDQIYEIMSFAPQKIGLLPEEFSMRDDEILEKNDGLKRQKYTTPEQVAKATKDKTIKGEYIPSYNVKTKVGEFSGAVSLNELKIYSPDAYINKAIELSESGLIRKSDIKPFDKSINKQEKLNWSDDIYSKAKSSVVSNLLFLYDNISPDIRDISKLWYDGANIIAQEISNKYGITLEQSAAVIATQSPQKDWFQNVHIAHFMVKFNAENQDTSIDKGLLDWYKKTAQKYEGQMKNIPVLEKLIGVKYKDLSHTDKSIMIRYYFDNFFKEKSYPLRISTGKIVGKVEYTPSFMGYGSIAKGVSVLVDGSKQNISDNIGKQLKVRNFYNNISNPNTEAEVTIDTHAIAAGYLLPIGQSADEVKFDNTTFGFFADAYREAAKQRGVLAREMQSITWEGVRALFPQSDKKDKSEKSLLSKVTKAWEDYRNNNVSLEETQQKIKEYGKDLSNTDWAGFRDSVYEEGKAGDYIKEFSAIRRLPDSFRERSSVRDSGRLPSVGERSIENGLKQQRIAPNGKPSNLNEWQYNIVRTDAFKNWFGDWESDPTNASKVIDENGEPLVVYTGTSKDKDFKSFNVPANGAWFTSDPKEASSYAIQNDSQKTVMEVKGGKFEFTDINVTPRVIPAFLNIKNPVDFRTTDLVSDAQREKLKYTDNYKKLQKILFQNIFYSKSLEERKSGDFIDGIKYTEGVYVVLKDPTQIKSAIGNLGTFSPSKTDIMQQKYVSTFQRDRDKLKNINKKSFKEYTRIFQKYLFERNINVKKALQANEMTYSLYMMYNKAGASMFGNLKFEKQFTIIYKGLTPEQNIQLDDLILLRRIIAIDTNFDNRGEKRPSHPMNYNKETATEAINNLKSEIGEEAFNELNQRANMYFEAFSTILKDKFDAGLIDESTYELYRNYDYMPRKFLEFMFDLEDGGSSNINSVANSFFNAGVGYMTKEELKRIKDGSFDEIYTDSAKLLQAAMISTERKIATNKALKMLAKEGFQNNAEWVKEVSYKKDAKGFILFNKDGSAQYNKEADKGFRIVFYKEDGIINPFQIKESYAREFFDEELWNRNSKAYKILQTASGAALLRNMATGLNLGFFISNIPVDVISQVQINNIYDGAGSGIGKQYAKAFSGTLSTSLKMWNKEVLGLDNNALDNLIYEYAEAGGLMMTLTEEYRTKSKVKILKGISEFLASTGNASELGSKLTAYSNKKQELIAKYKEKNNNQEPKGQDLEDIKTEAVYNARSAMDYHRGGILSKYVDGFVPYLNVMLQGFKITGNYIADNPVKFTSKIFQLGMIQAAITFSNLMLAGDDYDNDDNEFDLVNKIVIFMPFKNEDGTRGKVVISVPSQIKGFLNIYQNLAEAAWKKLNGEEYTISDAKIDMYQRVLKMFVPKFDAQVFPPALRSLMEYKTNKDLWRDMPITNDFGKVSVSSEGKEDKNVYDFYQIIGKAIDVSPARTQKAVENFIVPSNPLSALGHTLADKIVNGLFDIPEKEKSKASKESLSNVALTPLSQIAKRVYKTTDPEKDYSDDREQVNKIILEEGDSKKDIKSTIKFMVENNKSIKELNDYVNTLQDDSDKRTAKNTYEGLIVKNNLGFKDNYSDYMSVKYAGSARVKAKLLHYYYPFLLDNNNPATKTIMKDLSMLKILSPEVVRIYNEIDKQQNQ